MEEEDEEELEEEEMEDGIESVDSQSRYGINSLPFYSLGVCL